MRFLSIFGGLGAFLFTWPALAAGAATATTAAGGTDATFGVDSAAPAMMAGQPMAAWLVILPIALPLLGCAITLTLRRRLEWQLPIAMLSLIGGLLAAAGLFAYVSANGPIMMAMGDWLPPFAIVLAIDQLSALFVFVTALVGVIGLTYARADIGREGVRYGFYTFYCLLIAGVSGAFSTGDIFNLYVWFEVFLVSSFGLIVLGGTRIQLDGAVKYGVLNLIATTVFLIAIGFLYGATGTLNIADLQQVLSGQTSVTMTTIGALFLLGFAMKAASFPLHFWLPASYHTPKVIVSAIFAGLLTKVGVYCLMRVLIMMFGDSGNGLMPYIAVLGILTTMLGAFGALAQDELKRMAAFLVISGIGIMMIGIGLDTEAGLTGAIVYAVHSIFAMTALFLVLGLTEKVAGTDTLWRPGGLYSTHGLVAALFLVFGFAASGLPPFSGFWPKLMLVQASLAQPGWLAVLCALAIILGGFLTTIVVGRAWALVFLRPAATGAGAAAAPVTTSRVDPATLVLAAVVVGLGLFPRLVIGPAESGARAILDPAPYVSRVLEVN